MDNILKDINRELYLLIASPHNNHLNQLTSIPSEELKQQLSTVLQKQLLINNTNSSSINEELLFCRSMIAFGLNDIFNIQNENVVLELNQVNDKFAIKVKIDLPNKINNNFDLHGSTTETTYSTIEKEFQFNDNGFDFQKLKHDFLMGKNGLIMNVLKHYTNTNEFEFISHYLNHTSQELPYIQLVSRKNDTIGNSSLSELLDTDQPLYNINNINDYTYGVLDKAFFDIIKSEVVYFHKENKEKIAETLDYIDYVLDLDRFRIDKLHEKKGIGSGVDYGLNNGYLEYITGEYQGEDTQYCFNFNDFLQHIDERINLNIENKQSKKHSFK